MNEITEGIIFDFDEVVVQTGEDVPLGAGEYIAIEHSGDKKISNPDEIEALRQRRSIDEMKNEMLGHYDSVSGRYIIEKDLKEELRKVVKRIDSTVGSSIFASSVSSFGGLGKLFFIVSTKVDNFVATSTLFVCEPVTKIAGTVENTEVHKICTFSKKNSSFAANNFVTWQNFYKDMYDAFHILYGDSRINDEETKLFRGLIIKQKLLGKALYKNSSTMVESLEADLLLMRTEILSKLGDFGYSVLKDYEGLKVRARAFVNRPLTAQDQNEIIEEAIARNKDKFSARHYEEYNRKQAAKAREFFETVKEFKQQHKTQFEKEIDVRMPEFVENAKKYRTLETRKTTIEEEKRKGRNIDLSERASELADAVKNRGGKTESGKTQQKKPIELRPPVKESERPPAEIKGPPAETRTAPATTSAADQRQSTSQATSYNIDRSLAPPIQTYDDYLKQKSNAQTSQNTPEPAVVQNDIPAQKSAASTAEDEAEIAKIVAKAALIREEKEAIVAAERTKASAAKQKEDTRRNIGY